MHCAHAALSLTKIRIENINNIENPGNIFDILLGLVINSYS